MGEERLCHVEAVKLGRILREHLVELLNEAMRYKSINKIKMT